MSNSDFTIPKGPARPHRRVTNYAPTALPRESAAHFTLKETVDSSVEAQKPQNNTTAATEASRSAKNYATKNYAPVVPHTQQPLHTPDAEPLSPPAHKRKNKRIGIIAACCTLIIGGGAICAFSLFNIAPPTSTPVDETVISPELATEQTPVDTSENVVLLQTDVPTDENVTTLTIDETLNEENEDAAATAAEETTTEDTAVDASEDVTVAATENTTTSTTENIADDATSQTEPVDETMFEQAYLGTWVGRWSVATSDMTGFNSVVIDAKSDYTFSLELLDGTLITTGASWSPVNTSDGYTHILISFDTAEILADDPWCSSFIAGAGETGYDLIWDPGMMTYTYGDALCLVKTQ